MHYRGGVDFGDSAQDSILELGFGFHAHVSQERPGHFPKERFHQVEPGAMLGRVNIRKAVRSCG